jgi:uncharacterized protein YcsI (UPF0317 family)
VRTDLPEYRVYRDGSLVGEVGDLIDEWRDDAVAVLIGCSFTFEEALVAAGVPVRHLEEGVTVPMYRTRVDCVPAGRFARRHRAADPGRPRGAGGRGHRPLSRRPRGAGPRRRPGGARHRRPRRPRLGDRVDVRSGEVPVFWACGVTPQAVALASSPPWMLTHAPGRMLVLDLPNERLRS